MRRINSLPKNLIIAAITIAIATSFLTNIFLSGKIIDIPKGTQEGGLYGAIGIGVILIIVFTLIFIGFKIVKRKYKHLN